METAPIYPVIYEYTVSDWLEIHSISLSSSIEAVSGIHRISAPNFGSPRTDDFDLTADEAWSLAAQAIVDFAPELALDVKWLYEFCEKNMHAEAIEKPYTKERGKDQSPFVSLSYQGTPADVLCVAHEFGHALQYHLVKGRFIPPVLRELAAFVAEKALLDHIQKNRSELYEILRSAWQQDNRTYFGDDAVNLLDALKSSTAPYIYRMNYPLARLLSDVMFDALPRDERFKVFHGSLPLAECLLNTHKNDAALMNNYLPQVPEAEKDRPAVNAYRTLGAMALLDIDYWQGESEKSIEEYYSARLGHMQTQTAFVAIDSDRKPIGYATWEPDPNDAKIVRLKRQAAPFGGHLELQEKLQARLPDSVTVLSHHSRSAREEQVAW
jgi:hypothetical protein